MNHFTLFAHGVDFDPDAYLKQAPFDFDQVWRRGDPRGCPEVFQDQYPTSGVKRILGDGYTLSVDDQDRIAAEFLEEHEKQLAELSRYPGVDTFVLGLHYRIDVTPGLCGFCMSPSPRLMYFALKTGVDPTFYVDLVRTDELEECD